MIERRDARALRVALAAVSVLSIAACSTAPEPPPYSPPGPPPEGGGPTYHLLEVYVTGSGHVTNVSYGGRTCDSICGYTNASGATVSVLAEPDPYWAFGSWGPAGACTGTNPSINVVMDADKDCRATFVPIGPVQLSVGVTGTGTGTITGPRIDCGTDCGETYGTGQPVVLHASHSTTSKIDGWTNCVPSSDLQSCTVTMDASKRVEVSISLLAHLVVQVNPQGRITSADPAIDCAGTCEAYYEGGKQVTLTATPLPGWHFDSWSGCPNPPSANTCTVTIGSGGDAYVSARFVQDPLVGVQVVTSGSGTVTGSGLNCGSSGSACAIAMPAGTVVTLTATADYGSCFDHWTGDCSGIGSPTQVTAGPGITCTAVFQPGAGPDRSRIVAGSGHSCAIKPDGSVRCWGTGAPLGNGLATGSKAPVTVSGIPGQGGLSAVALAAGGTHTCALLSDQTVRCWGSNGMGQLGDGTTGAALSPIAATGITSAVAIATGNMHTCAVLDDTTVRCWGDNRYGQLGNGSTSASGELLPVQVMRRASVPASGFTSASAAVLVTCAQVVGSVDVQCWGTDAQGEFGNGQPSQQHFYADTANVLNMIAPVRMASGGTVGGTTCVVEANAGGVACWGLGASGQLGNGASASSSVPVWATGILLATDVAVGSDHACARLTNGEVHCWGAGTVGQIGDNYPHATNVPQRVILAGTRAEVVGSGPAANHTCVLADDGTAWCWGAALAGQLGDGTAGPGLYVPYPVQVQGF